MKIALLGCCKKKQGKDNPKKLFKAQDIYLGNSFRKSKNIGVKMYKCDDYYILSAKHHLLDKNEMISYYDKTLNKMSVKERQDWANIVLKELGDKFDLTKDEFYIFAGGNYYKYLVDHLEHYTIFEYENSNSILLDKPKTYNKSKNNNFLNAKDLRMPKNLESLPNNSPGYYKWWCDKDTLNIIINKLNIDFNDIKNDLETKDNLYCIYIGIAVKESIKDRINWHINQKHSESAVKSKALSTLRQSISSIVANDQYNEEATNAFIDKLKIEFFELPYKVKDNEAIIKAHQVEKDYMEKHLYILNIQDNHHNKAREIKKRLKKLRKDSLKEKILVTNS